MEPLKNQGLNCEKVEFNCEKYEKWDLPP